MKEQKPTAASTLSATPGAMPAASDRIELLQTFVRIVQAGSLSAAAAQLGTTQPTVSRRLQLLERSLGLRLLQRSTHTMKLTEDGERCYERARELLGNWESFESDLRSASVDARGSLRVLVPHAFGQQQLIGPLAEFMRRHPAVTVEWLLHDRVDDLIGRGIDCAIHVGDVTDPTLVAIKIAEVPRALAAAPSLLAQHPPIEQPADLAPLPWLAIPTYYRRSVALTHTSGDKAEIAIQPRLSSDSLFALSNAAVEGMGVCLVSAWLLRPYFDNGSLVELLPEWQAAPLPIYIVYPYARVYPARLRLFVDTMREAMPANMHGADHWIRR